MSQFIFVTEQKAHISVQSDDEILRIAMLWWNNALKKKN